MVFRNDALAGLHIVISGGCGAIGVGIVKKLTEHGANVTVNDILSFQLATERLSENGIDMEKINYVKADLTRADETEVGYRSNLPCAGTESDSAWHYATA